MPPAVKAFLDGVGLAVLALSLGYSILAQDIPVAIIGSALYLGRKLS